MPAASILVSFTNFLSGSQGTGLFTHSEHIKTLGSFLGTVISALYWLNTKVVGGQDSRSRHPGNISLCLHSTLQTTPAQSPYPYIPLGALTPFCLVQSITSAAAQRLGNRDSPRQSFFLLQNTVQINSK